MKERVIVLIIAAISLVIGYQNGNSNTVFQIANIFISLLAFFLSPFFVGYYLKKDYQTSGLMFIFILLVLFYNFNHSIKWGIVLTILQVTQLVLVKIKLQNDNDTLDKFTLFSNNTSLLRIISSYKGGVFVKLSFAFILVFVVITRFW